ncbi:MAG: hypothetical protein JW748_00930 [Anaerolineales bacterium]|nr:hypothetical protein [Anaerolineales bacterium]
MISPPPQYLYRDVQYHPPEADRLADKILEKIRQFTMEKDKVETSSRYLDSNWEGRRKETFVSEADPHKRKTLEELEHLRKQEQYFRTIKVTRREQYVNPDWEAWQRGRR